jgi:EAL domain-containing protein (putative c-di-GMP-specific phosphodiesterase class I)
LLRWQHPQRGLILPDAFIPLAENTGLIGPLTRFVLGAALVQARAWADAGRPLQVAVNLSARNLLDDGLDAMVVDLLAAHGVEPGLLKLEVTESAIMSDPVRAKALLERLSAHGIAISIDDFGVGYTSLAQLKNLPISELKVDRSFVTTMTADVSNSLIVRSVIELSHNLGLSAVAEGVESAQTLDRLAAYDCDVAQGYHLSRPLPGDVFDRWRAAWPGLPTVAPAP